MPLDGAQDIQGSFDIDRQVGGRVGPCQSDGGLAGQVTNYIRRRVEGPCYIVRIPNVTLDEVSGLGDVVPLAGVEVVQHGDAKTVIEKGVDQMAADKTGASGYQNVTTILTGQLVLLDAVGPGFEFVAVGPSKILTNQQPFEPDAQECEEISAALFLEKQLAFARGSVAP